MYEHIICKACGGKAYTGGDDTWNEEEMRRLKTAHKYGYHVDCWESLDSFKKVMLIRKNKYENF
jgi:hypothetical protein